MTNITNITKTSAATFSPPLESNLLDGSPASSPVATGSAAGADSPLGQLPSMNMDQCMFFEWLETVCKWNERGTIHPDLFIDEPPESPFYQAAAYLGTSVGDVLVWHYRLGENDRSEVIVMSSGLSHGPKEIVERLQACPQISYSC